MADGKEPPPDMTSVWISSAAVDRANYGGGLWVLVDEANLCMSGVVRLAGDDNGELELIYLLHPSLWVCDWYFHEEKYRKARRLCGVNSLENDRNPIGYGWFDNPAEL